MAEVIFYFGGFSPVGGIETYARNLLIDFQKREFQCELFCWGSNSSLLQQLSQAGVRVRRLGWRWGCRINLPDWFMLLEGIARIRHRRIVLFGKPLPYTVMRILRHAAGPGARFVFITPYRPVVAEDEGERRRQLDRLNLYDAIWVQSASFAEDLRAIGYLGRIDVIPYMPEPTQAAKPYPSGQIRIGFLGRLVEDKRVSLLLEAFRHFREHYLISGFGLDDAPTLDVYGDGHLRSELENASRRLGIAASVHFHGSIPQSQVRDAVGNCHMFVFTSRAEGQCLAALEILSCGRPVVATAAGAFEDILSDSRLGLLVRIDTAHEVSAGMRRMVDRIQANSVTPEEVQGACLERFGANEIGARYAAVMKELLSGWRGAS